MNELTTSLLEDVDTTELKETKEERLERELEEALEDRRELQLLIAAAKRDREDARQAKDSAIEHERRAEKLADEARKELERNNKFHPYLMPTEYIESDRVTVSPAPSDALTVRFIGPKIHWDDERDMGMVKLVFCSTGRVHMYDTVAYAVSERMLRDVNPKYLEPLLGDMGKNIADDLIEVVKQKLGK